ncbi:NIC-domain-containing protein [Saccharata proteae CBS 121410]|uniref:NIC-domain-containing protein n=1 Tax=Saccharata proteae CBS 121410 TaxID=1314787 RepID=A0A9P4LWK0_9PEZI|nr:NIC-domain-containing protein [Saccharata proteae CBS 121410]
MSLFGNLGGNQPQGTSSGTSLFGNTGGATANSGGGGGGLFGGLNNNAPKTAANTTGGLFGATSGTGNSGSAQPASNLFGNLGGGGAGASTSQPQSTNTGGGLFGGLGASTTQPQGQQAGGLFGNLGGSTTANNQQQQQPQQQQQGQTGQERGPLSQSQAGPPQSAYFDHLLERGKKRQVAENGGTAFGDLPSLQLGLGDIARKVRNLGTGGPSSPQARQGHAADSRAHYLLAASGVNTSSALRDLNQFGASVGVNTTVPAANVLDTDIENYITNLHSQSTLAMIAEGLEQSKRDFDNFLEDNVQMEWDAQRKRIYEHFGLGKQAENLEASTAAPGPLGATGAFGRSRRRGRGLGASASGAHGMSFGHSGMGRSVIGTPAGLGGSMRPNGFADSTNGAAAGSVAMGPESRFQREKQEKLAEKVYQLNMARLEERPYPILKEFADATKLSGADVSEDLEDAFDALRSIVGEDGIQVKSEGRFSAAYLDEQTNSERAIDLRKRIINGSRQFLERKFFDQMKRDVRQNRAEAEAGGEPTAISWVRAYIRVQDRQKQLSADNVQLQRVGEDYVWVLVYHLIRCGLIEDALRYIQENDVAIKSLDRSFPAYINGYATGKDRRLAGELQHRITAEYSQRSRVAPENSLDPYRMACYKIIGRCDLSHPSISLGVKGKNPRDDYAWSLFAMAREVNRVEETANETFTLDDVRKIVTQIHQRNFQGPDSSPEYAVCFKLMMLAGMFEEGVNFLYPHNYTTAVHFAIGLAYYGLLRISDFFTAGNDILSFTTREKPQINFCRIIGHYTRDFRAAKAVDATDYLTLLCLNAERNTPLGKSQAATTHEALRELVLETREFAQLLGDIRSDGTRIKGAIELRLPLINIDDEPNYLQNVTLQAAAVAEEAGRTTDAVLLYHLAEDFDAVIATTNTALSDAIAVDLGQPAHTLEPPKPRQAEKTGLGGREPESSLSITAARTPRELAQYVMALYSKSGLYWSKIKRSNQDALTVLINIADAKALVEEGISMQALDKINSLSLLPVHALGDTAIIRHLAANFNALPPVISRLIGPLLMWTLACCGRERAKLGADEFLTGGAASLRDQLMQAARDLMVFAGLVRYKLPPRVFEALAVAGQDAGAY